MNAEHEPGTRDLEPGTTRSSADVVIIGGGVVGSSIAYHLREAGCRGRVVVIEREKAESLLTLAAKKVDEERARISDIESGASIRPKWLDGALRAAGVLRDGETL